MRPGKVIGTVTLHAGAPAFKGGRWLLVSPMDAADLSGTRTSPFGPGSTPVVYDNLGAGTGDTILFVEGAEAMQPFPHPIPIDALNVALVDHYNFTPPEE